MLVKAKCNVKDAGGLHRVGDVWNTDEDLGELVEVLETRKPVKKAETLATEEQKAETKPRVSTRRKPGK